MENYLKERKKYLNVMKQLHLKRSNDVEQHKYIRDINKGHLKYVNTRLNEIKLLEDFLNSNKSKV